MPPRIVQIDDAAIAEAVEILRNGGAVGMPTETVYGLAVDTFNVEAIRAVYALKGRPSDNPLIAHVAASGDAKKLSRDWDDDCAIVADECWPGPLTLVVHRSASVPSESCAGLSTIAIRCPRHPAAQRLLVTFGGPLSAPSANRSGHVSPTTAQHVADEFADAEELLILDGGACETGLESTVVDMTQSPPRILRPGSITEDQLSETLNESVTESVATEQGASPGTRARHYAPNLPVVLCRADEIESRLSRTLEPQFVLSIALQTTEPRHTLRRMPSDAQTYARLLYKSLREAEASGASGIVIEMPPRTDNMWPAIHDRLRRAAAPR